MLISIEWFRLFNIRMRFSLKNKQKVTLIVLLSFMFFILYGCVNSHKETDKPKILYFTIGNITLHSQMPKDSILLLLGTPQDIQSSLNNGILTEKYIYVIPKTKSDAERIIKLNESFKNGLIDLNVYKSIITSLTSELSLMLENNVLIGYNQN